MTDLRYSPLHVTEFCGEMQGKFKVGPAQLITLVESTYPSQRPECPSLSSHFLLAKGVTEHYGV